LSIRPSEILESFKSQFADFRQHPRGVLALSGSGGSSLATKSASSMIEAKGAAIMPRYTLQEKLRPAFGKGAPCDRTIGDHPDFTHLAGTDETATCPIVTLFMDIESSTRLELLYGPAETAKIKNAFLCTAIEMVHAFDGHVHRLQGDAVMAFFGGSTVRPENAAVDAINCAGALWLFVKSTVIPTLQREGYDEDFGIRIGVDYAPDAHWSSFGYPGVDEVTATGFGVSAAAKLQHAAGRNQIMLGQRLVEFLDLPDAVTKAKYVQRDGKEELEPFLLPNITLRDGKPHNYRKVLLRAEEYLRCGPLAEVAAQFTGDRNFQPLRLSMSVCREKGGATIAGYSAASLVLPKNHWIRFDLSLPFQPMFPYTVKFEVENHGREAESDGGDTRGNHSTEKTVSSVSQHTNLVHWEHTAYRGLHYMTITVSNSSGTVARRRVGVFIE
jgi:adenylate cyclase